jgi:nucleoside-diphosphate-sugar epimerase
MLEVFRGKLEDSRFCHEMLHGQETVVHVAAPLVGAVSSLSASGVVPTRVLVNACVDRGVRRFVLISSMGVYGTQALSNNDVLDEHCPVDSHPHLRDPYTYSKIAQEEVCWEAYRIHGLPLVVIRPGVLFGPGRSILSARIGLVVGGTMIQMGGRQQVPYCYVDNCAGAIARSIEARDITGMAFNVVDDELPSANRVLSIHRQKVEAIRVIKIPRFAIGTLARLCESYSRRTKGMFPPVLTQHKSLALWKPLQYRNELAKAMLGWTPSVHFDEGIQRAVQARRAM